MKKIRAAIVGTGFVGVIHIEALRRLGFVDVVAICERGDAKSKAESLYVENGYNDYKKMIDEENLDFIHICTPNITHYEITKYALLKNVNVVLEKPMTFNSDEAKELVELASQKKLVCAVNYHNRLYPATAYIRDIISKGEIGDVISINGMYVQDWLLYDTDYSWRLIGKESGSTRTVADIGSHWVDLIEYLSGEKIVSVLAEFKIVHPVRKKAVGDVESFSIVEAKEYKEFKIDTEDIVTLMFKLSNGAIGTALFSQMVAGKKNKIDVLISGTKASVEWNLENHEEVIIGNRKKPNQIIKKDNLMMNKFTGLFDYPSGHLEGYADAFKQVFKQVYTNTKNPSYASFYDGYRQMVINEKIYESAKSRSWIDIEV
jgi:predicted dehydrogenase